LNTSKDIGYILVTIIAKDTICMVNMSLEETSKLLTESRKVIEDSGNNVDNSPIYLTWYSE